MNVALITTKDLLLEEIESLTENLLNWSDGVRYSKKGGWITPNGNRLSMTAVNDPTISNGMVKNHRNIFVSGYDSDDLYCLHVMDYNNTKRLTVTYEGDNYPTVINK
jgi:hypothetical protein